MELERCQRIKDYLKAVCSQIKYRDIHDSINWELSGHIEDLVEEYIQAGIPEEEAVEKAIAQMGDAKNLGKQLHRTHRPRIDWSLVAVVASLISLGLLVLYSIEASGLNTLNDSLFTNRLIFLLIGAAVMAGIYLTDCRRLRSVSRPLYAGTLLVGLFALISGTGRYYALHLGGFSVNFIGTTPYLFAIALAGILAEWDWDKPGRFWTAFGLMAVPGLLYLTSSSMSVALIYFVVCIALTISSGAKRGHVFLLSAPPAVLALLMVTQHPYRMERFTAFFNPHRDPLGAGYIINRSLEAIRSAGFWGRGFTFPEHTLPMIETDMIFTYIIYTLGWAVGLAVTALVLTFIIRMACSAGQVKDRYGRLLMIGIISIFTVQFGWNILMVFGLVPIMGVTMPFVSYSGLQFLVQMAAVGWF